jgi:hypothetical protein
MLKSARFGYLGFRGGTFGDPGGTAVWRSFEKKKEKEKTV